VFYLGIWVDSNDNIYFTQHRLHSIRMVRAVDDTIVTVAGSLIGALGFQDGDGTDALFNSPYGLHGNDQFLIVTDCNNGAIRKIDLTSSDHTVTTIVSCASGDCFIGGDFDPYATHGGNEVYLESPFSAFIDGNYLYFVEESRLVIYQTDLSTSSYMTKIICGDYDVPANPFSLYVATKGSDKSIYVSDASPRIQRFDLSADQNSVSVPTLIAGQLDVYDASPDNVDASQSSVSVPLGLWVDEDQQILYFVEINGPTVRTIDLNIGNNYKLGTFAGAKGAYDYDGNNNGDGGSPTSAKLTQPFAIYSRNSNFYIFDNSIGRIRKVSKSSLKGIHSHLRKV
jgi:hypothetical protein